MEGSGWLFRGPGDRTTPASPGLAVRKVCVEWGGEEVGGSMVFILFAVLPKSA